MQQIQQWSAWNEENPKVNVEDYIPHDIFIKILSDCIPRTNFTLSKIICYCILLNICCSSRLIASKNLIFVRSVCPTS